MKTGYSFGSLVSFTEALNAAAVKITGDQTIAGVKTFSSNPISSAAQGMGGSHLTRKDYVDGALALKAPLASPALTGTPTASTAAAGTDTTQLATTAFVQTAKETARTTTYIVANEAAMLALINAKKGDLAIRSDLNNRTFILYAEPYSTLLNWRVLAENVVISDFAKTLLDDVDAAAMRTTLGIDGLPILTFIGDTPPINPWDGVTWYCTTDGRSYVWYTDADSSQWVEYSPQSTSDTGVAGGYIGDNPPIQPNVGATWYCTVDGRNYTWYEDNDSGQWVESSPQSVDSVPTNKMTLNAAATDAATTTALVNQIRAGLIANGLAQ